MVYTSHLKRTLGRYRGKKNQFWPCFSSLQKPSMATLVCRIRTYYWELHSRSSAVWYLSNIISQYGTSYDLIKQLLLSPIHICSPTMWSLWLTPVPLHWKNLTFSEYRLSPALDGQDGVSSPPRWLPAWVPCLPQFTGSQVFLDPYSKLPAVLDSMPHLAYMRLCPCPIWELLKGKVCVLFIFKTLYHLASWEVQNK